MPVKRKKAAATPQFVTALPPGRKAPLTEQPKTLLPAFQQEVGIPNDLAGFAIGRSGWRLKQYQQLPGIEICEAFRRKDVTIFRVEGVPAAVEEVIAAIRVNAIPPSRYQGFRLHPFVENYLYLKGIAPVVGEHVGVRSMRIRCTVPRSILVVEADVRYASSVFAEIATRLSELQNEFTADEAPDATHPE